MNINDRIRELRANKGLIQEDIAKALNMPRTTYAKYEHNINPPYDTIQKIANYFNVSIDYLVNGNEVIKPPKIVVYSDQNKIIDISDLDPETRAKIEEIIQLYKNKTK